MSAQISQSMAKCMQSFISQVDGQKPVATNMEMQQMAGTYNIGEDKPEINASNKGDISQQIMETHGSRVK